MIDCAHYLHQILLDKHTLISTVNTKRLKIRFEARQLKDLNLPAGFPQIHVRALGLGIDPVQAPAPVPGIRVGVDAFLKLHIMTVDDVKLTVKHVIGYVRNVDGGGHYDPTALTGEYALLRKIGGEFLIQGVPMAVAQIAPLAAVTLRGLQPLIADVSARVRA